MAISFVGSLPAVGANNGGNVTLSFSNLRDAGGGTPTLQEGDLVVCAYMSSGTADAAMSTSSSNWNELHENYANGTSNDTNLAVYWKVMGPSPDTQFVAVGPTGNSNATVAVAFAFRGVDTAGPIDVFTSGSHAVTGTATGRPNPATITPATAGAWIIAVGAAAAATGATFTNPGDLSATTNHFRALSHAETIDGMLGMGIKTDWASGTFDPAAWTSGTNNAGDSWAAMTLALKPAPPVATCTPVDEFQGQTIDVPTVTPAIATAANDAAQAQTMDAPTVGAVFVVTVNGAGQGQVADASAIVASTAAAPVDAAQGQQADQPAMTPAVAAASDDLAQQQASDQPTVGFVATAVPVGALQEQGIDAASVAPGAPAAANDAFQGQSTDQATAVAIGVAGPVAVVQGQSADAAGIAPSIAASAQDAAQGQAVDAPIAGPSVGASPADAAQAQSEDAAAVTAVASVTPAASAQGQSEDSPDVGGSGSAAAVPDGVAQGQSAGVPSISPRAFAAANDVLQLQTVAYRTPLVTPHRRRAYPRREPRTAAGPRRPSRNAAPNLQS